MADALLQVTGLSKRFGGIVATDDLSLSIRQGELHAVIGPNGAGKTTL
ncbi:MAG: ATP-binding cassette domain-containing protein, partial [Acidobacteriota bacterium]